MQQIQKNVLRNTLASDIHHHVTRKNINKSNILCNKEIRRWAVFSLRGIMNTFSTSKNINMTINWAKLVDTAAI